MLKAVTIKGSILQQTQKLPRIMKKFDQVYVLATVKSI